jgi:hypothetical protein
MSYHDTRIILGCLRLRSLPRNLHELENAYYDSESESLGRRLASESAAVTVTWLRVGTWTLTVTHSSSPWPWRRLYLIRQDLLVSESSSTSESNLSSYHPHQGVWWGFASIFRPPLAYQILPRLPSPSTICPGRRRLESWSMDSELESLLTVELQNIC